MSDAPLMTPRELSARMRSGKGAPIRDWRAIRDALTPEQVEAIRAKCQWEQCSWLAVLRDWPSLFERLPSRMLYTCATPGCSEAGRGFTDEPTHCSICLCDLAGVFDTTGTLRTEEELLSAVEPA